MLKELRGVVRGLYLRIIYKGIILKNIIYLMVKGKIDNKYLFILAPPYSGSTLLNEVLSTSKNVSVNNPFGTREGQQLPRVIDRMMKTVDRWDSSAQLNWIWIKKQWMKYWDLTRPILLEKSPPNIVRAQTIQELFNPSYFIVFVRDPYALCEGLIRRNNTPAKQAADFVTYVFKYQKLNAERLQNVLLLSYEELGEAPEKITSKLISFLPELLNLNVTKDFRAHNFHERPLKITNLNSEKIKRLSDDQIDEINSVFAEQVDVINYFGYDLIHG